jgi:hypothetical protein
MIFRSPLVFAEGLFFLKLGRNKLKIIDFNHQKIYDKFEFNIHN